ncbi:hypothetical protein DPMN_014266 [Dreissena polymorpha]|uniref:Uncharacterized protein n=1 Tax=Dreissena polymorpha TaxID=45954 RepID=A0A9D4NAK8_DREPO|nr:hypothetical protein DPMN_014266 [Dreissena polymorpha]
MTVAEAIGSAFDFELISNQGDFALDIRKSLKQAKPLPWPPTADDLDAYAPEDIIPRELLSFLTKMYFLGYLPCCNKWRVEVFQAHFVMYNGSASLSQQDTHYNVEPPGPL